MATQVPNIFRQASTKLFRNNAQLKPCTRILCRNESRVYSETGAILAKPSETKFSLLKSLAAVIPLMYLGATLSKNGAAWLEENDIFVPDDDDD